jgi:hypothetical protein
VTPTDPREHPRVVAPGVLAEDLRALADVVPFDQRTRDLLEAAAERLDPS